MRTGVASRERVSFIASTSAGLCSLFKVPLNYHAYVFESGVYLDYWIWGGGMGNAGSLNDVGSGLFHVLYTLVLESLTFAFLLFLALIMQSITGYPI